MRIINKLSFAAAILAFLGTLIIAMDRFGPIHTAIDQFARWKNIALAIEDLNTFDTPTADGNEVGMVEYYRPGFSELVQIVYSNRPDLRDKYIIAIAMNKPITVGGVPMNTVHVLFMNDDQGYSLAPLYTFQEWIGEYRDRYFLKIGLSIIVLGFLLSVLGHIELRSTKYKRSNKSKRSRKSHMRVHSSHI